MGEDICTLAVYSREFLDARSATLKRNTIGEVQNPGNDAMATAAIHGLERNGNRTAMQQ